MTKRSHLPPPRHAPAACQGQSSTPVSCCGLPLFCTNSKGWAGCCCLSLSTWVCEAGKHPSIQAPGEGAAAGLPSLQLFTPPVERKEGGLGLRPRAGQGLGSKTETSISRHLGEVSTRCHGPKLKMQAQIANNPNNLRPAALSNKTIRGICF